MSRITETFERLREAGKKGFIAYITAGDPNLSITKDLVREFERCGVDIVELGVPFSDPLADGPVNQEAAQRALKHNTSLSDVLRTVDELRRETAVPIILFTYFNPVFRYGLERCVKRCAEVGVDGILLLDLPPEEGDEYKGLVDHYELDAIFLITPTSTEKRIELIAQRASGFIYYVSRTGVTGERERLADSISPMIATIRRYTTLPIAVGFGVSRPEHIREISEYADAVVVGSAIVRKVGGGDSVVEIGKFVEELLSPLKGTHS